MSEKSKEELKRLRKLRINKWLNKIIPDEEEGQTYFQIDEEGYTRMFKKEYGEYWYWNDSRHTWMQDKKKNRYLSRERSRKIMEQGEDDFKVESKIINAIKDL